MQFSYLFPAKEPTRQMLLCRVNEAENANFACASEFCVRCEKCEVFT